MNESAVRHISLAEFEQQATEATKKALNDLQTSEEYLRWCRSCWYDGHFLTVCRECAGFAMQRPCPVCEGKCGKVWDREANMSKALKCDHWEGECGLPHREQHHHLVRRFTDYSEETVVEALQDLSTS